MVAARGWAEAPSRRVVVTDGKRFEVGGEEVESVILGLECVFLVKGLFPMGGVEGVHSRVMIPGPS